MRSQTGEIIESVNEIDEEHDQTIRMLLRVVADLGGSASEAEITALLGPRMVEAGLVDLPGKVDRVYVGRDLLGYCQRHDPPLIHRFYRPEDLDHLKRPRSEAVLQFALTDAGAELLE